jgi:hypothetical protein
MCLAVVLLAGGAMQRLASEASPEPIFCAVTSAPGADTATAGAGDVSEDVAEVVVEEGVTDDDIAGDGVVGDGGADEGATAITKAFSRRTEIGR